MSGSTCAFVSINSSIAGSILGIPVGVWGGVWAYNVPSPNPAKRNHITSSRNFFLSASTPRNCIRAAGDLYTARYMTSSVAVGTIINDRPPHRTVRAALPHTAPTLEDCERCCYSHTAQSLEHSLPRTVSG